MGDMAEDFKLLNKIHKITNEVRSKFFTKIVKNLGGKYLTSETYRLGDYNCYVSKGFAKHKSNRSKSISLVKLLNEKFGTNLTHKEIRNKINKALAENNIYIIEDKR